MIFQNEANQRYAMVFDCQTIKDCIDFPTDRYVDFIATNDDREATIKSQRLCSNANFSLTP
jgi:hypothetical protein